MPVRMSPEVLLVAGVLLLTGLGACLLLRGRQRRMHALAEVSAWTALLGPEALRPRVVRGLVLRMAALVLIFIALLRPQWGEQWETIEREGLDLMVVLDVSRSMWAEDVAPNRLERARWELADALAHIRGDRIGLVMFAGDAQVLCPLTTDTRAFALLLDDARPERIARGGTALPLALRAAMDALGPPGEADRVILIISDGENHEGDLFALTDALREADIRVFCIGVGTHEGAPIPLPPEADGGFVRDRQGQVVRTRLDEPMLRRLAEETGGAYVRAATESFGLDRLYAGPLAELRRARVEVRPLRLPRERFQLFLFAALLCLFLEWRPSGTSVRPQSGPAFRAPVFLLVGLLATGAARPDAQEARYWMAAGNDALERGDWVRAAGAFERAAEVAPGRRLDPAPAWFNAGLARARGGEHETAALLFDRALESPDPGARARAHLHAGASLSRLADAAADRVDWTSAAERLEQAIRAYAEAMRLGLDDEDVRRRRAREIERLAEFRRRAERDEAYEAADPARPPDETEPEEPDEDPTPDPDAHQDGPAKDDPPLDAASGIPGPPEPGTEIRDVPPEDAQRILDALLDEERAHRGQMRTRAAPVPVEKDW